MGLGPNWSTGCTPTSNPKPTNFKILRCWYQNGYTVAIVNYPDCTNYEGNKILLFEGHRITAIENSIELDPHFLEGSHLVGRFSPSVAGERAAMEITGPWNEILILNKTATRPCVVCGTWLTDNQSWWDSPNEHTYCDFDCYKLWDG